MDIFTDEKFDTISLLRFLYQKRKWILGTTFGVFFVALAVTFFIPPKFYSVGIIFPTASNSPDDILKNPQFGYEVHADRLMQILESEVLRDSIIGLYDLATYYKVNKNDLDWKYKLDKAFVEDVTFFRSKYMSIVITATMRDPQLAADIVNSIIDMVDGLRENIFRQNAQEALAAIELEYFDKINSVNHLVDSIYTMREGNTEESLNLLGSRISRKQKGVNQSRTDLADIQNRYNFFDIQSQDKILNEQLALANSSFQSETGKLRYLESQTGIADTTLINTRARLEGAKQNVTELKKQLDELKTVKKGYSFLKSRIEADNALLNSMQVEYESMLNKPEPYVNSIKLERLINSYGFAQARLNELQNRYEEALSIFKKPFPKVYVIDRARPSLRKSSPSFTLNGGLAAFCGFVFSIVFLFLFERYQAVKDQITGA